MRAFSCTFIAAAITLGGAAARAQQAPIASPRDTARATIGSAHLLVDYGRPSKRSRVIYGGLVPWGEVWRTGANAATTFVTDRPLRMGSTTVPAGTYTLYSVPSQSGQWLLVVNKQTKQWGTEYHQEQDLARIPMTTSPVTPSVEQFTIAIEPQGPGGTIDLIWDTTRAKVAFSVE